MVAASRSTSYLWRDAALLLSARSTSHAEPAGLDHQEEPGVHADRVPLAQRNSHDREADDVPETAGIGQSGPHAGAKARDSSVAEAFARCSTVHGQERSLEMAGRGRTGSGGAPRVPFIPQSFAPKGSEQKAYPRRVMGASQGSSVASAPPPDRSAAGRSPSLWHSDSTLRGASNSLDGANPITPRVPNRNERRDRDVA